MNSKKYLLRLGLCVGMSLSLLSSQAQNPDPKPFRLASQKKSEKDNKSLINSSKARPDFRTSAYPHAAEYASFVDGVWDVWGLDSLKFNDFGNIIYTYITQEDIREYTTFNAQNNREQIISTLNGQEVDKQVYRYDPYRTDYIFESVKYNKQNGQWVEYYHHHKKIDRDANNNVLSVKFYSIFEGDTALLSTYSMKYGADNRATDYVVVSNAEGKIDTVMKYENMKWTEWTGHMLDEDLTGPNKLASATVYQYSRDGIAVADMEGIYHSDGYIWYHYQHDYLGVTDVKFLDEYGGVENVFLDIAIDEVNGVRDSSYLWGLRVRETFDSCGNFALLSEEELVFDESSSHIMKPLDELTFSTSSATEFVNNYDADGRIMRVTMYDFLDGQMEPQEKTVFSYPLPDKILKPKPIKALNVYPNPVSDLLHIDADGQYSVVQVCDMTGRAIKTFEFKAHGSYNLAELSEGYYVVKIIGNAGISTAKIYKTK